MIRLTDEQWERIIALACKARPPFSWTAKGGLPVVQSSKFKPIINAQTAQILGLDVPPTLRARADEVNEAAHVHYAVRCVGGVANSWSSPVWPAPDRQPKSTIRIVRRRLLGREVEAAARLDWP
jgi:hypothetical protein